MQYIKIVRVCYEIFSGDGSGKFQEVELRENPFSWSKAGNKRTIGCFSPCLVPSLARYMFSMDSRIHNMLIFLPSSQVATMIYVDSPAGAGLSYSETSDDYNTNDTRTIDDLYIFLQKLMVIMPELAEQDLYIAGVWFRISL